MRGSVTVEPLLSPFPPFTLSPIPEPERTPGPHRFWGPRLLLIYEHPPGETFTMDPNLHQKQGINHLRRVLDYAPMIADADGTATVHLTREDWHVVADTLFAMNMPKEMLPEGIQGYEMIDDNSSIQLTTSGLTIRVDVI